MPRISVVIPVYNVAPYLRECLDSVLAQTFTDWEAICVDDGSTDGSGVILDEYAVKDLRFKVLHQKNAGVSAARNAALDVAQGEWVCFIDGDDVVASNWLHAAREVGAAMPGMDWIRIGWRYWDGGPRIKDVACSTPKLISGVDLMRWGWSRLTTEGFVFINFIRTEIARSIGFDPKVHLQEDMHFVLKLLPRVKSVAIVDSALYYYRQRMGSAWLSAFPVEHVVSTIEAYLRIWLAQRDKVRGIKMDERLAHGITYGVICVIDKWSGRVDCVYPEDRRRMLTLARRAFKCGAIRMDGFSRKKDLLKWVLYLLLGRPAVLCPRAAIRRFAKRVARKNIL